MLKNMVFFTLHVNGGVKINISHYLIVNMAFLALNLTNDGTFVPSPEQKPLQQRENKENKDARQRE